MILEEKQLILLLFSLECTFERFILEMVLPA